jgi:hypothetical protein
VDAARVQILGEALAQEVARRDQLVAILAEEQAQAAKMARSLKRTQGRIRSKIELAASEGRHAQPATAKEIRDLAREVRRERELGWELDRINAQVQGSSQALAQAQSRVPELERALALAMAQARTLAWQRAQARSPRLRAIAVAQFLWRLLQARPGLWDGIVRNLYLGMKVVELAVWMLPTADRDRWRNESYNELEELKEEGAPLLGDAIRIALRIPWLTVVLWTGALGHSPAARWLARLKPVWIGLGTAAATFWAGAAGIGQSPTDWQMRSLVAASLLAGVVAAAESDPRRRPRRRRRKRR